MGPLVRCLEGGEAAAEPVASDDDQDEGQRQHDRCPQRDSDDTGKRPATLLLGGAIADACTEQVTFSSTCGYGLADWLYRRTRRSTVAEGALCLARELDPAR